MVKRKKDDWVDSALKIGLGLLALHFVSKLGQNNTQQSEKTCNYCGHTATKWARMCPNCRNTFPI